MALRMLMLDKKLREKRGFFDELKSVDFSQREAELAQSIEEAKTDEERAAVEEAIAEFEKEKRENEEARAALEKEIGEIELEIADLERDDQPKEQEDKKEENRGMEKVAEKRGLLYRVSEERRAMILNAPETRDFVEQIKTAVMEKRAITGAGLTIPDVMLDLIRENVFEYSKLVNRVRLRSISGEARQTIAGTVPEAVWTEMCANLNELSFAFNQVTIDGYKVGGYVALCNAILQDSYLDMAAEIVTMLGQAVGFALDKAILYGKGAAGKMPLGIVTRLAQTQKPSDYPVNAPAWVDLHTTNILQIATGKTGAEFFQELIKDIGATRTPYARGNMFWAMNSVTYNQMMSNATVIDATGAIVARVNGVMPVVGGDIVVLEFIPDGDIIGGFGDLYLLGERRGIVVDQSEHVQFIQDNTVFRATARYDGLPVIPKAFVAININGQAPTTEMDFAYDFANRSAALSALSIASATLAPAFDEGVTSYTASTTEASGKITATAKDPSATVKIYVNGAGVASDTPTWNDGENVVLVNVTNGLNEQNYTVIVTKTAVAKMAAKAASK